jgi:hypothetical protein
MGIFVWIALYAIGTLIWLWIAFWGGDETLLGYFVAISLLSADPGNDPTAIRFVVGLFWVLYTILFVIGLIMPDVRFG